MRKTLIIKKRINSSVVVCTTVKVAGRPDYPLLRVMLRCKMAAFPRRGKVQLRLATLEKNRGREEKKAKEGKKG